MSVLRIDAENGGVGQSWEIGELTDHAASIMTSQFHAHSTNAACSFAQTLVSNKLIPQSKHPSIKNSTMLDVAGGSGCFSVQMALSCASLYCTIFKLPAVATYTRQHIDRFVSNSHLVRKSRISKTTTSLELRFERQFWVIAYDVWRIHVVFT